MRVGILRGNKTAVPRAVHQQPLVGRIDQIGIAVNGFSVGIIALQNAEIGQHLPHMRAFGGGLGEIMRAGRGGKAVGIAVGGVVAVALKAFGNQEIALAVACQIPCGGQGCRAAAEYQHGTIVFARGGFGKLPVAQQMPLRQPDFAQRQRRRAGKTTVPPPRCGRGGGKGGGSLEELAAVHGGMRRRSFQAACTARVC